MSTSCARQRTPKVIVLRETFEECSGLLFFAKRQPSEHAVRAQLVVYLSSAQALGASALNRIRTNNGIGRINREIRRRTRIVGTFPNGNSALMLVTERLKYITEHEWGKRRYLDMSKQEEMDKLKGKAKG